MAREFSVIIEQDAAGVVVVVDVAKGAMTCSERVAFAMLFAVSLAKMTMVYAPLFA